MRLVAYPCWLVPRHLIANASRQTCILLGNTHTWPAALIARTQGDGARRGKKVVDVWEEKRGVEGYL